MALPIGDQVFEGQQITIMSETLMSQLTPKSVRMIINFHVEKNDSQKIIQPSLINRLNF